MRDFIAVSRIRYLGHSNDKPQYQKIETLIPISSIKFIYRKGNGCTCVCLNGMEIGLAHEHWELEDSWDQICEQFRL